MVQCVQAAPPVDPGVSYGPPDGSCRSCPLDGLDPASLADAVKRPRSAIGFEVPAGALVNLARNRDRWLLTLCRGLLKVASADPDGRQAAAGLRYPGDPLEAYDACPRGELYLEAVVPSTICALDRRILDVAPGVAVRVLARRLEQTQALLIAAERRQISLLAKPPDARIAWLLLDLAARPEHHADGGNGAGAGIVRLFLRRGDIAECLGLAPETVSRVLTRLQRAGVVRKLGRDRLQIVNRAALAALAADGARPS